MNSIASNQEFVKGNLPRKIVSKVSANLGHTRFVLVDKYIDVESHHQCFKMRLVMLTDKENSLYQKKACFNLSLNNPNFFTGPKIWPVKKLPCKSLPDADEPSGVIPAIGRPVARMTPESELLNKKHLLLGFDSEWVEAQGKRHLLSYQLSTYIGEDELLEFILFTDGRRLTLDRLLSIYAQQLTEEFDLDLEPNASNHDKPVICYLVPHYSLVDITTFTNSLELLRNTDTLRRSQTSVQKPYFAKVFDRHYNYRQTWAVILRDTMHLAPAGSSLAELAKAMGRVKLELMPGYSKDDMARYLQEQPDEFIMYACNDATLTLDYVKNLYSDTKIPVTLGSEGAEKFRDAIKEIHDWGDKEFDFYFRGLLTIRDDNMRKKLIARPEAVAVLEIANHCYYGGRNETFLFGIHHSEAWNDYDLSGAYPTAMAMLPDPDFDRVGIQTGEIINVDPLAYCFGLVDFEFPPDTPFPCLPVRDSEGRGLVFPLKGRTFANGPELYAALRMGARLRWVQAGYIIGNTGEYTMQEALSDLLKERAKAKEMFGKGSIQEIRLKEMVNSIYGKLAQGLARKRNYSTRTDKVDDLPPSSVTQPLIAAMTTSIVRAIVSIAMHQLHSKGFRIASVTTDGFLTDAPIEVLNSLNLYGFKAVYEAVRNMLVGDPTMWETKHRTRSLVMVKTRGGFGVGAVGNDKLPVAKAGYKPETNFIQTYGDKASEELARRFLERTGKMEMTYYKLPSPREYIQKGADGLGKLEKKKIDWEYDYKRKPVNIRMEKITINGRDYEHVAFDTVPWETYFDFVNARSIKKAHPELFPMKDADKAKMMDAMIKDREAARRAGMLVQSGEKGGIFRTATISYLRDLMAGREQPAAWMRGLSYAQLAEALNERLKSLNVKITVNDLKNAKRRKDSGRLGNAEALEIIKELLK